MATKSTGQVRYCIRCDRSGSARMRRLIDSPVVEDGMATGDYGDMEIWVHDDCLGEHRAKVLARGLATIGRAEAPQHETAAGDERCSGLLQQLADDLAANGYKPGV